ncbi:MAG: acetolactate synthase small subunit [Clostridia bacterium]|nr:acetolactate synthase small subunit [Clostridia bacterium]
MKDNKFVIAVYVDNKSGVLTRVTSMFTRRGFNIDALTVGETERPEYSRITICMSGDGYAREQMINQLRKQVNVIKVEALDEDAIIKRELMLIKIKNDSENRSDVMTAVDVFRAKVIDYTTTELCIEVTGEPTKIDAFVRLMEPFGILEMCRTGIVALERGSNTLFNSSKNGQ